MTVSAPEPSSRFNEAPAILPGRAGGNVTGAPA